MEAISRETSELFSQALGDAVVRIWSRLPQDIQHQLFEEALTSEWEGMRSQLAVFLHHKHARTASGVAARALVEPDSLGG
jgi:hypothetical protein